MHLTGIAFGIPDWLLLSGLFKIIGIILPVVGALFGLWPDTGELGGTGNKGLQIAGVNLLVQVYRRARISETSQQTQTPHETPRFWE